MDYETHLYNRDHVQSMASDEDTPERIEILNQRQTTIAAQWSKVSYQLHQYQLDQKRLLKGDPYQFWASSVKHRIILMAVINAHFDGAKLSASTVASDLGYSRASVQKLLKDAQELGLLIEEGGCPYKPSIDTIDGFIFYTSETLSMDQMVKLSAGVIRLKTGTFKAAANQIHEKNRKKLLR